MVDGRASGAIDLAHVVRYHAVINHRGLSFISAGYTFSYCYASQSVIVVLCEARHQHLKLMTAGDWEKINRITLLYKAFDLSCERSW